MTRAGVVVVQFTPRGFDSGGASAYTGLPERRLPPASIIDGRTRLWLREDLDAHLERLAGRSAPAAGDEWDEAVRR